MPYKSEKQRRFLHARHPEIAARWDAEYGRKVSKARIPKPFTKKRALAMGAGGGTGLLAYREVPKLLKPPMGYEQEYVYKGLSPNQIEGLKRAYSNADADIETERARMGNAFSDDTSQHVNRQKYAFARRMRKVEGDRAAKQIAREKAGAPPVRRGFALSMPGKEIATAQETIGHGARNKTVEDRSLQLAQRHQPLRVPPSITQHGKRAELLARRPDLVAEMKGRKVKAAEASAAKYRAAGVRAFRIFGKGLSRHAIAGMSSAILRGDAAQRLAEARVKVGKPVGRALNRDMALGHYADIRVSARNMGQRTGQMIRRSMPPKPRTPEEQDALDIALIPVKVPSRGIRDLSREAQYRAEGFTTGPPYKIGTKATERRMELMKDPAIASRRWRMADEAEFNSAISNLRAKSPYPADAPPRKRRQRTVAKGLTDLGLRNSLLRDRDHSMSAVSKAVATDSWADEQRYLENKQRADDKRRRGHKKTQIGGLMLGTTGLAGVSAPQWSKGNRHVHIGGYNKPAYTVLSSTKSPKGVHNVTTIPRLRITSTKNPLLWAGTGAGLIGWGAQQRASAGRQTRKLNRTIDNRIANERAVQIQQWANRGAAPKRDSE